jgi:multidrug efflux pump subunit AcrB
VYPIEVRLSGKDRDAVFALADDVKAKLGSLPGTKGIIDDWGRRTKKLVVNVSQARARRAGVTNEDIAISLQTVLTGFSNTQYREDEKVIPITVRSVAADRQDVDKIESLLIYSSLTGQAVPLKQVADVVPVWQASKVRRRNGLRTVTVKSDLALGITAAEVNAVLAPWLTEASAKWAPGYSYELGGEIETSGKANASIAAKLPIAGFIILMLLVAQFNSIRRAAIILATIPLGLIGVSFGLVVCRSYMGFMTFLGIISLAGIVINNAIVLLERVQLEIDGGLVAGQAVVQAALLRMRPILLTTATTVAGLLPLWLGGGPMWEPMAVAIIFGLLFSTALTLGVVPVLYSVLFWVDRGEVS